MCMFQNQKNKKNSGKTKKEISFVRIKAEIDIEYYAISKESLEQLNESSVISNAFDLSLFFFSISITLFIAILTAEIKNNFLVIILVIVAVSMFIIGVFKYSMHRKNQKRISKILEKVKKQRCYLK